jgi:peptide/nickel transport system permease protein
MSAIGPAIFIVATGIGFSLLGEALNAGLDPRRQVRRRRRAAAPASTTAAPAAQADPDAVLSVAGLRVTSAEGVELVRGVDLSVRRGEMLGIVGESGSGKTLTMSAMARILPGTLAYTATHHRLLGQNLLGVPAGRLRELIGPRLAMVFQNPMSSLNPALRVGSQLSQKLRAHERVTRKAARERVIAALEAVRIPEPARRARQHPYELSGGMQQRVMIAMATLGDPEVILADEPTTALDVSVQAQVIELLAGVNRDRGAAVVLVSHDLALVSQTCERVVVMYAGRVVEEGPSAELIAGPRHPYTKMLIGAIPDLSRGVEEDLVAIPGTPPAAEEIGAGCPFADRCPSVMRRCRTDEPVLAGERHRAACWLTEEPAHA